MSDAETAFGLTKWAADQFADKGLIISFAAAVIAVIGIGANYWGAKASAELARRANDPGTAEYREHDHDGVITVEMWPRGGQWYPFFVAVTASDRAKLVNIAYGPPGILPQFSINYGETSVSMDDRYSGIEIQNPINKDIHAYVTITSRPGEIIYGQRQPPNMHRLGP